MMVFLQNEFEMLQSIREGSTECKRVFTAVWQRFCHTADSEGQSTCQDLFLRGYPVKFRPIRLGFFLCGPNDSVFVMRRSIEGVHS